MGYVVLSLFKSRHSGRDCRNPGYMDVYEPTIRGTGYSLPFGYVAFFLLKNL